eukprot:2351938-Pyramimonas_sp.AAC.1
MAELARGSPTQYRASWPHKELHRQPQWLHSHASPPPSTAILGAIGNSTEGPTGCTRMNVLHPI